MADSGLSIRLADPDKDFGRIAELRNYAQISPTSAKRMLTEDHGRDENDFLTRIVGEHDGAIVATGHVGCSLWDSRGLHYLKAWVDPDMQTRGFGARLLEYLEVLARQSGAEMVKSSTLDSDTNSRRFLENRGYKFNSHAFSSELNLENFNPASHEVGALPSGLKMFSFSETAMGDEANRMLWELNIDSVLDEPNNHPPFTPTFEAYSKQIVGASWFDPTLQIIASVGDRWAGICAVGQLGEGCFHNLYTGVRREFRGLGIAKALKVRGLALAKDRGAKSIRTGNDSRNGPMLAINQRLGYFSQAGQFEFRKHLY